jgi:hypothetical protein
MFGNSKDLSGARAKIEAAQKMKKSGYFDGERRRSGGGDIKYPSQTIAITLVFGVGVVLSAFLTGNSTSPFAGMHFTGIAAIDNFITGSGITAFTGNPDEDKVMTIFARGGIFAAVAGVVPFITAVLERLLLRRYVMPHIITWGVIMTLMLLYFFAGDLGTLIKSL